VGVMSVAPALVPALTGPAMDRYAVLLALAGMGLVGLLVLRSHPKVGVALWFLVVCFVPTWVEANVGVLIPPTTLVGGVLLASMALLLPSRVTVADWLVGFFFVACLVPVLVGASSLAAVSAVILKWLIPFLVGRLLPLRVPTDWIYRCAGVFFTGVSVLAILESLLRWNPFVTVVANNVDYRTWSPLQQRGSLLRVEGAFGHSIALGTSIALVLPLVLGSSLRTRTKVVMVAAMLSAVVLTLSRIGIVCSVLALVLFVVFSRGGLTTRARAVLSGVLVVGVLAATPSLLSVFDRAGSEPSLSAVYRSQLTELVPYVSVLGVAPNQHRTATGEVFFGSYRSIDNALILLGLTYGFVALAFALLLLTCAVVAVVARAATPPVLAMAAQVPAVASVALITQYEMLFWFVGGLALATLTGRGLGPPRTDASGNQAQAHSLTV
jgi:hypothetical protein